MINRKTGRIFQVKGSVENFHFSNATKFDQQTNPLLS